MEANSRTVLKWEGEKKRQCGDGLPFSPKCFRQTAIILSPSSMPFILVVLHSNRDLHTTEWLKIASIYIIAPIKKKKLCLSSAWVCKNENIHRVNFQLNILNRKSNVTNVLVHVQCPAYTFFFILSFIQIDSKLCVAQVNFVQKSFKFQSTSRYKQIIERTIALHVNWTFLKWATKMKLCQCAAEKKKCTNKKKNWKMF